MVVHVTMRPNCPQPVDHYVYDIGGSLFEVRREVMGVDKEYVMWSML